MASLLTALVGGRQQHLAGVAAFVAASLAVARTLRRRALTTSAAVPPVVVDAEKVNACIADLVRGGPGNLYIIMDFDRTMSMYWDESRTRRAASSHGILERGRSTAFRDTAEALTQHYFPIEIDPSLSTAQKLPHMVEWYDRVHSAFVADGLTRGDIERAVSGSGVVLREGVTDTIAWCARHSVPLIVMSAGLGDVITEVLRQRLHPSPLPQILHVVSNAMRFDPAGAVVGFSEPVLHMFNKTGASIPGELAGALRGRSHAILVGDSPGDATMADGLGHTALLKVGLLNDNIAALLARYRALFDVLILDDGSLAPLVDILRRVAA